MKFALFVRKVSTMASSKWFDLRASNATLERLKSDADGVFLKLTVKNPGDFEAKADAIVAAGWIAVPSEPNAFLNRERMVAMSEIKKSLLAFFDDEKIALTDISKLPGNIYVGGFERGKPVEPETLRPNILGLNEHTQSEILKRVASAAALAGLGAKASFPFDGQLIAQWKECYERVGPGATGAVLASVNEFKRGNPDNAAIIAKVLVSSQDAADFRERQLSISNSISSVITHQTKQVNDLFPAIEKLISSGKDGLKKAHSTVLMNSLALNIPVTMLDAKLVANKERGETLPDKISNVSVRYETGLPTELKWQSAKRIEAAFKAVEKHFGSPTGHIFGPQAMSIMITRKGVAEGIAGHMKSRSVENTVIGQIGYSPYSSGALIHEIGHAVDFGHMKDRSDPTYRELKYKKILEETGVRDAAITLVHAAVDAGLTLRDNYIEYLLSPEEIFARTFEAAMVQICVDQGDTELESIGGGLLEHMDFVSDDPTILQNFVNAVKKWNMEFALEHANDKRAERESERGADVMAL